MITIEEFKTLVLELLGDNLDQNTSQKEAIEFAGEKILMITAGPGSGKTRVLVLRALRHVLVDGILPENILITTFTRKAAKELRTRWLDWGTSFLDSISNRNTSFRNYIERNIDINRCRIDTLDSISEQTLTEYKLPGQVAPILLEESAAKLVLKRQAFRGTYRQNQLVLDAFLRNFTFDRNDPVNQGQALRVVKTICDRLVQDLVDLENYRRVDQAHQLIVDILNNYQAYLRQNNLYDFAFLERVFLERLQNGTLDNWCEEVKVLLIDEYQDTNPLQEAIYFEIISRVNPHVTVVGDDDQAMYRFRGGSVELFTQFSNRCLNRTGRETERVDMIINYRSSAEIVSFYNSHITGDPQFIPARIIPTKPEVISNRGLQEMPVLGLFRRNKEDLAESLAELIQQIIDSRRFVFSDEDRNYELCLAGNGDLGDFVFLSHSVQEIKYDHWSDNDKTEFAGHFRNSLDSRGLSVFNPRGLALRSIPDVQVLLGLLLLCLDPDESNTSNAFPTNEASFFLNLWRSAANNFIRQNPSPSDNEGIFRFVRDWQGASLGSINFPPDWPVLELIFKLITWMPGFQNDPEHQVWLEAITRIVSSTSAASPYGMLLHQSNQHRVRSRQSFIRDALLPIAENEVDVDEDIIPSVPRNYLQIMTIHQAKGLEFPLVIVDVGSRFKINSPFQRFLRFPEHTSNVVVMEDDVEPFLEEPIRWERAPLDRTYDDIMRLYYVAYSRPQSVLLLVGCENCLRYGREGSLGDGAIPNIALGWTRDGFWPWRQDYSGRRPVRVDPPFVLL